MLLKQLTFASLFIGVSLFAEVKDLWKINVGGMEVINFETDIQWSKAGIPVGAKINTKDQLGMDNSSIAFRVDGYYRFNKAHRIVASYFAVRSDGHTAAHEEFEWDGNVIGAGATIDSYFNMDIYKLNYAYSFYHSEQMEVSLAIGLHITKIDLGLSAVGTINDVPKESFADAVSVTAPLPVLGFQGEYAIVPNNLFVNYKTYAFYLEFDDYKGALVRSILGLEYRFLEHVGVGLGLDSTIINVEDDDGDEKIEAENILTGIMVYFTYTY